MNSKDKPIAAGVPLALLVLIYVAAYFAFAQLRFPLEKDELHFWPTALFFSHSLFPSPEQLRTYNDLNTPVPFLLFGGLEHLFHQGEWLARLTNLFFSFGCAVAVLFANRKATRASALGTLGLLCFPYFVGVSTHVYTDTIAAAFTLAGVAFFFRNQWLLSAVFFAGAVSSRQYAVVFPVAILFFVRPKGRALVSLVFPVVVLLSWFIFWKGPANALALKSQVVATAGWMSLLPQNCGYFLACVAAYFCIPELLFFSESRSDFKQQLAQQKKLALTTIAVIFIFALFPPLGNLPPYPFAEMGLLDKGLRTLFSDFWRITALAMLALLAAIRFSNHRLTTYFVLINTLLMAKAHLAWDKYALSLILVLWWFRSESNSLTHDAHLLARHVAIGKSSK